MPISRREFLRTAGAAGALVASGAWRYGAKAAGAASTTAGGVIPTPDHSGIEHIVVVMMENRSFDHFLGWMPGADGIQAGLSFYDNPLHTGTAHPTYHLDGEYSGCAHPDPDHSWEGGRVQFNGGSM